jgi:hypothetical protein
MGLNSGPHADTLPLEPLHQPTILLLSLPLYFPDEDSNLSPSPLRDLSGSLGGQEEEEEQRWLDALEKGELDDNGDLKKEINERLLTARQVSWLIPHSFTKYILRTCHVPSTLLHSGVTNGREKNSFCSYGAGILRYVWGMVVNTFFFFKGALFMTRK